MTQTERTEMEIFENGLLKNEFINRNYRGLVGWKIDYEYDLVAVRNRRAMYVNENDDLHNTVTDTVNIKQFYPEKIPHGELCWFGNDSGDWIFAKLRRVDCERGKYVSDMGLGQNWEHCVPYLIAETKERAELLKYWHKD